MLKNFKKITFLLIILTAFSFVSVNAKEIPVIVIAPSKTPQSISTVGTSVKVLDEQDLIGSKDFFLGDLLNNSVPGMNFFQTGGAGTQMGLQLFTLMGLKNQMHQLQRMIFTLTIYLQGQYQELKF